MFSKPIALLFLFCTIYSSAQEMSGYYALSELKDRPKSLQGLISYDKLQKDFSEIGLSATQYNSILYDNPVYGEKVKSKGRLEQADLILEQKIKLNANQLSGFTLTVNPLLKTGQYSRHLLQTSTSETDTITTFYTNDVRIDFPANLINFNSKKDSVGILVKTSGIEKIHSKGIRLEDATTAEIAPFTIVGTPINVNNPKNVTASLELTKGSEAVFKNEILADFVKNYSEINNNIPQESYYNTFKLSNAKSLILIGKNNYMADVEALYFNNYITAGVLKLHIIDKTLFASDVALFNGQISEKEAIESLMGVYNNNMYYYIAMKEGKFHLYFYLLRS